MKKQFGLLTLSLVLATSAYAKDDTDKVVCGGIDSLKCLAALPAATAGTKAWAESSARASQLTRIGPSDVIKFSDINELDTIVNNNPADHTITLEYTRQITVDGKKVSKPFTLTFAGKNKRHVTSIINETEKQGAKFIGGTVAPTNPSAVFAKNIKQLRRTSRTGLVGMTVGGAVIAGEIVSTAKENAFSSTEAEVAIQPYKHSSAKPLKSRPVIEVSDYGTLLSPPPQQEKNGAK